MPPQGARLFYAVELDEALCRELAGWARRTVRGARVLDAASLHLTLVFLGSRPFAEIDALAELLERATARREPFELALGAPLLLPRRRPRALAVEAHEPSGELVRLQAELAVQAGEDPAAEPRSRAAGARPPGGRPRSYRPHITVARPRPGGELARELAEPTPPLAFTARHAVLYRSFLDPGGARYEALARASLGA